MQLFRHTIATHRISYILKTRCVRRAKSPTIAPIIEKDVEKNDKTYSTPRWKYEALATLRHRALGKYENTT